ncbi:MAG TPA: hypothetical protein VF039_01155 [Longimicrobiales bacterium]
MHTEHLSNVGFASILVGWLIAVAVTSLLVFLFTAAGWMSSTGDAGTAWAVVAVAIGFLAGGYLTGTRDIEAPILHGVGIGLTTLVAWFVINALATFFVDATSYTGLGATATAGLLLLQMIAAVIGAWIADRRALRGEDLPGERLG